MLELPKGYKYWHKVNGKDKITEGAPKWAKDEFKEYQDKMNSKPDKNGTITEYQAPSE